MKELGHATMSIILHLAIASAARVDNWSFDGGIARAPAKRLRPLALQLPQPPSTMTTPVTVTMTVTMMMMMMRLGC